MIEFCIMTYDGYTPARKEANRRYMKEKTETITVYLPKGKRQIIKDAAADAGISVNKLIVSAIEEKINISLQND